MLSPAIELSSILTRASRPANTLGIGSLPGVSEDVWNPARYGRFGPERSQPLEDLVALLRPRGAPRVLDLGCGTGEHTARLHAYLGARSSLGLDASASMLAEAPRAPGLEFRLGRIEDFEPDEPFDLVVSNAALHWVEDHPRLLSRLVGWLAPAGQLAVQVPANHHHPSQTVAAEVAGEEPFATALGGYRRVSPVLEPEAYRRHLEHLGCRACEAHERVYDHRLESAAEVVEWVRGTTLTDYQRRMPSGLYADYLERYRARLLAVLPDERPFRFPFRRVFFTGERPA